MIKLKNLTTLHVDLKKSLADETISSQVIVSITHAFWYLFCFCEIVCIAIDWTSFCRMDEFNRNSQLCRDMRCQLFRKFLIEFLFLLFKQLIFPIFFPFVPVQWHLFSSFAIMCKQKSRYLSTAIFQYLLRLYEFVQ